MKSDLNKTFREIFDNDGAALYKQLFQVREFQLDRKESERWMQRPRFLKLYKPSDFDVVGRKRTALGLGEP
ncbi:hypothetical protein PtrV1_14035 [Pyrenophora tritici-repentis]|nr:hypothetical protein PtrV1_14035 [Pyrenophora tritici-repentis]